MVHDPSRNPPRMMDDHTPAVPGERRVARPAVPRERSIAPPAGAREDETLRAVLNQLVPESAGVSIEQRVESLKYILGNITHTVLPTAGQGASLSAIQQALEERLRQQAAAAAAAADPQQQPQPQPQPQQPLALAAEHGIDYRGFPEKVQNTLRQFDPDLSGTVSVEELQIAANARGELMKRMRLLKLFSIASFFLVILLIGCMFAMGMTSLTVASDGGWFDQFNISSAGGNSSRRLQQTFGHIDSRRLVTTDSDGQVLKDKGGTKNIQVESYAADFDIYDFPLHSSLVQDNVEALSYAFGVDKAATAKVEGVQVRQGFLTAGGVIANEYVIKTSAGVVRIYPGRPPTMYLPELGRSRTICGKFLVGKEVPDISSGRAAGMQAFYGSEVADNSDEYCTSGISWNFQITTKSGGCSFKSSFPNLQGQALFSTHDKTAKFQVDVTGQFDKKVEVADFWPTKFELVPSQRWSFCDFSLIWLAGGSRGVQSWKFNFQPLAGNTGQLKDYKPGNKVAHTIPSGVQVVLKTQDLDTPVSDVTCSVSGRLARDVVLPEGEGVLKPNSRSWEVELENVAFKESVRGNFQSHLLALPSLPDHLACRRSGETEELVVWLAVGAQPHMEELCAPLRTFNNQLLLCSGTYSGRPVWASEDGKSIIRFASPAELKRSGPTGRFVVRRKDGPRGLSAGLEALLGGMPIEPTLTTGTTSARRRAFVQPDPLNKVYLVMLDEGQRAGSWCLSFPKGSQKLITAECNTRDKYQYFGVSWDGAEIQPYAYPGQCLDMLGMEVGENGASRAEYEVGKNTCSMMARSQRFTGPPGTWGGKDYLKSIWKSNRCITWDDSFGDVIVKVQACKQVADVETVGRRRSGMGNTFEWVDPGGVDQDCEADVTPFSVCSKTCGGGVRERDVTIKLQPRGDGTPCPARFESCNDFPCPGHRHPSLSIKMRDAGGVESCLDAESASDTSPVTLRPCTNAVTQHWLFENSWLRLKGTFDCLSTKLMLAPCSSSVSADWSMADGNLRTSFLGLCMQTGLAYCCLLRESSGALGVGRCLETTSLWHADDGACDVSDGRGFGRCWNFNSEMTGGSTGAGAKVAQSDLLWRNGADRSCPEAAGTGNSCSNSVLIEDPAAGELILPQGNGDGRTGLEVLVIHIQFATNSADDLPSGPLPKITAQLQVINWESPTECTGLFELPGDEVVCNLLVRNPVRAQALRIAIQSSSASSVSLKYVSMRAKWAGNYFFLQQPPASGSTYKLSSGQALETPIYFITAIAEASTQPEAIAMGNVHVALKSAKESKAGGVQARMHQVIDDQLPGKQAMVADLLVTNWPSAAQLSIEGSDKFGMKRFSLISEGERIVLLDSETEVPYGQNKYWLEGTQGGTSLADSVQIFSVPVYYRITLEVRAWVRTCGNGHLKAQVPGFPARPLIWMGDSGGTTFLWKEWPMTLDIFSGIKVDGAGGEYDLLASFSSIDLNLGGTDKLPLFREMLKGAGGDDQMELTADGGALKLSFPLTSEALIVQSDSDSPTSCASVHDSCKDITTVDACRTALGKMSIVPGLMEVDVQKSGFTYTDGETVVAEACFDQDLQTICTSKRVTSAAKASLKLELKASQANATLHVAVYQAASDGCASVLCGGSLTTSVSSSQASCESNCRERDDLVQLRVSAKLSDASKAACTLADRPDNPAEPVVFVCTPQSRFLSFEAVELEFPTQQEDEQVQVAEVAVIAEHPSDGPVSSCLNPDSAKRVCACTARLFSVMARTMDTEEAGTAAPVTLSYSLESDPQKGLPAYKAPTSFLSAIGAPPGGSLRKIMMVPGMPRSLTLTVDSDDEYGLDSLSISYGGSDGNVVDNGGTLNAAQGPGFGRYWVGRGAKGQSLQTYRIRNSVYSITLRGGDTKLFGELQVEFVVQGIKREPVTFTHYLNPHQMMTKSVTLPGAPSKMRLMLVPTASEQSTGLRRLQATQNAESDYCFSSLSVFDEVMSDRKALKSGCISLETRDMTFELLTEYRGQTCGTEPDTNCWMSDKFPMEDIAKQADDTCADPIAAGDQMLQGLGLPMCIQGGQAECAPLCDRGIKSCVGYGVYQFLASGVQVCYFLPRPDSPPFVPVLNVLTQSEATVASAQIFARACPTAQTVAIQLDGDNFVTHTTTASMANGGQISVLCNRLDPTLQGVVTLACNGGSYTQLDPTSGGSPCTKLQCITVPATATSCPVPAGANATSLRSFGGAACVEPGTVDAGAMVEIYCRQGFSKPPQAPNQIECKCSAPKKGEPMKNCDFDQDALAQMCVFEADGTDMNVGTAVHVTLGSMEWTGLMDVATQQAQEPARVIFDPRNQLGSFFVDPSASQTSMPAVRLEASIEISAPPFEGEGIDGSIEVIGHKMLLSGRNLELPGMISAPANATASGSTVAWNVVAWSMGIDASPPAPPPPAPIPSRRRSRRRRSRRRRSRRRRSRRRAASRLLSAGENGTADRKDLTEELSTDRNGTRGGPLAAILEFSRQRNARRPQVDDDDDDDAPDTSLDAAATAAARRLQAIETLQANRNSPATMVLTGSIDLEHFAEPMLENLKMILPFFSRAVSQFWGPFFFTGDGGSTSAVASTPDETGSDRYVTKIRELLRKMGNKFGMGDFRTLRLGGILPNMRTASVHWSSSQDGSASTTPPSLEIRVSYMLCDEIYTSSVDVSLVKKMSEYVGKDITFRMMMCIAKELANQLLVQGVDLVQQGVDQIEQAANTALQSANSTAQSFEAAKFLRDTGLIESLTYLLNFGNIDFDVDAALGKPINDAKKEVNKGLAQVSGMIPEARTMASDVIVAEVDKLKQFLGLNKPPSEWDMPSLSFMEFQDDSQIGARSPGLKLSFDGEVDPSPKIVEMLGFVATILGISPDSKLFWTFEANIYFGTFLDNLQKNSIANAAKKGDWTKALPNAVRLAANVKIGDAAMDATVFDNVLSTKMESTNNVSFENVLDLMDGIRLFREVKATILKFQTDVAAGGRLDSSWLLSIFPVLQSWNVKCSVKLTNFELDCKANAEISSGNLGLLGKPIPVTNLPLVQGSDLMQGFYDAFKQGLDIGAEVLERTYNGFWAQLSTAGVDVVMFMFYVALEAAAASLPKTRPASLTLQPYLPVEVEVGQDFASGKFIRFEKLGDGTGLTQPIVGFSVALKIATVKIHAHLKLSADGVVINGDLSIPMVGNLTVTMSMGYEVTVGKFGELPSIIGSESGLYVTANWRLSDGLPKVPSVPSVPGLPLRQLGVASDDDIFSMDPEELLRNWKLMDQESLWAHSLRLYRDTLHDDMHNYARKLFDNHQRSGRHLSTSFEDWAQETLGLDNLVGSFLQSDAVKKLNIFPEITSMQVVGGISLQDPFCQSCAFRMEYKLCHQDTVVLLKLADLLANPQAGVGGPLGDLFTKLKDCIVKTVKENAGTWALMIADVLKDLVKNPISFGGGVVTLEHPTNSSRGPDFQFVLNEGGSPKFLVAMAGRMLVPSVPLLDRSSSSLVLSDKVIRIQGSVDLSAMAAPISNGVSATYDLAADYALEDGNFKVSQFNITLGAHVPKTAFQSWVASLTSSLSTGGRRLQIQDSQPRRLTLSSLMSNVSLCDDEDESGCQAEQNSEEALARRLEWVVGAENFFPDLKMKVTGGVKIAANGGTTPDFKVSFSVKQCGESFVLNSGNLATLGMAAIAPVFQNKATELQNSMVQLAGGITATALQSLLPNLNSPTPLEFASGLITIYRYQDKSSGRLDVSLQVTEECQFAFNAKATVAVRGMFSADMMLSATENILKLNVSALEIPLPDGFDSMVWSLYFSIPTSMIMGQNIVVSGTNIPNPAVFGSAVVLELSLVNVEKLSKQVMDALKGTGLFDWLDPLIQELMPGQSLDDVASLRIKRQFTRVTIKPGGDINGELELEIVFLEEVLMITAQVSPADLFHFNMGKLLNQLLPPFKEWILKKGLPAVVKLINRFTEGGGRLQLGSLLISNIKVANSDKQDEAGGVICSADLSMSSPFPMRVEGLTLVIPGSTAGSIRLTADIQLLESISASVLFKLPVAVLMGSQVANIDRTIVLEVGVNPGDMISDVYQKLHDMGLTQSLVPMSSFFGMEVDDLLPSISLINLNAVVPMDTPEASKLTLEVQGGWMGDPLDYKIDLLTGTGSMVETKGNNPSNPTGGRRLTWSKSEQLKKQGSPIRGRALIGSARPGGIHDLRRRLQANALGGAAGALGGAAGNELAKFASSLIDPKEIVNAFKDDMLTKLGDPGFYCTVGQHLFSNVGSFSGSIEMGPVTFAGTLGLPTAVRARQLRMRRLARNSDSESLREHRRLAQENFLSRQRALQAIGSEPGACLVGNLNIGLPFLFGTSVDFKASFGPRQVRAEAQASIFGLNAGARVSLPTDLLFNPDSPLKYEKNFEIEVFITDFGFINDALGVFPGMFFRDADKPRLLSLMLFTKVALSSTGSSKKSSVLPPSADQDAAAGKSDLSLALKFTLCQKVTTLNIPTAAPSGSSGYMEIAMNLGTSILPPVMNCLFGGEQQRRLMAQGPRSVGGARRLSGLNMMRGNNLSQSNGSSLDDENMLSALFPGSSLNEGIDLVPWPEIEARIKRLEQHRKLQGGGELIGGAVKGFLGFYKELNDDNGMIQKFMRQLGLPPVKMRPLVKGDPVAVGLELYNNPTDLATSPIFRPFFKKFEVAMACGATFGTDVPNVYLELDVPAIEICPDEMFTPFEDAKKNAAENGVASMPSACLSAKGSAAFNMFDNVIKFEVSVYQPHFLYILPWSKALALTRVSPEQPIYMKFGMMMAPPVPQALTIKMGGLIARRQGDSVENCPAPQGGRPREGNWIYEGCYTAGFFDSAGGSNTLAEESLPLGFDAREKCSQLCWKRGMRFFALKGKRDCHCGASFSRNVPASNFGCKPCHQGMMPDFGDAFCVHRTMQESERSPCVELLTDINLELSMANIMKNRIFMYISDELTMSMMLQAFTGLALPQGIASFVDDCLGSIGPFKLDVSMQGIQMAGQIRLGRFLGGAVIMSKLSLGLNPMGLTAALVTSQSCVGLDIGGCTGLYLDRFRQPPKTGQLLVSEFNGACLDFNFGNGNAYFSGCHAAPNQQWYFAGEHLKTGHDDTVCLHYQTFDRNVVLKPCKENELVQLWYFDDKSRLRTRQDDDFCANQNKVGGNLYMYKCHDLANQRFEFRDRNVDRASVIRCMYDSTCLDWNWNNGDVYGSRCHGQSNQQWFFRGEQLRSKRDPNMCAFHQGSDHNLVAKPCSNATETFFWIDDERRFRSRLNGYCMDKVPNKGHVYFGPCHSQSNQKWIFEAKEKMETEAKNTQMALNVGTGYDAVVETMSDAFPDWQVPFDKSQAGIQMNLEITTERQRFDFDGGVELRLFGHMLCRVEAAAVVENRKGEFYMNARARGDLFGGVLRIDGSIFVYGPQFAIGSTLTVNIELIKNTIVRALRSSGVGVIQKIADFVRDFPLNSMGMELGVAAGNKCGRVLLRVFANWGGEFFDWNILEFGNQRCDHAALTNLVENNVPIPGGGGDPRAAADALFDFGKFIYAFGKSMLQLLWIIVKLIFRALISGLLALFNWFSGYHPDGTGAGCTWWRCWKDTNKHAWCKTIDECGKDSDCKGMPHLKIGGGPDRCENPGPEHRAPADFSEGFRRLNPSNITYNYLDNFRHRPHDLKNFIRSKPRWGDTETASGNETHLHVTPHSVPDEQDLQELLWLTGLEDQDHPGFGPQKEKIADYPKVLPTLRQVMTEAWPKLWNGMNFHGDADSWMRSKGWLE